MKKEYMKPTIQVVELRQRTHILVGSNYGVNEQLIDEEVDEGW